MTRRTAGERLFDGCNYLLLALLGLCTLYPFMYVLTISLSTPADIHQLGLHFFPLNPTLQAYEQAIRNPALYDAYWNTILRTILGVACSVLLTSLTAYPVSKKTFPFRGWIMKLFVFSIMFNGGLIPSYLLVKQLGLIDSVWALVLPSAVVGFNVIVMRNFFEALPGELEESAKIDGAGDWRLFFQIVLPISKPVVAVIALWVAVYQWNAWLDALVYMNDPSKLVLQLFLRRTVIDETISIVPDLGILDQSQLVQENLEAAVIMMILLPILLVYPFIQRYFAKGILLGSVKG